MADNSNGNSSGGSGGGGGPYYYDQSAKFNPTTAVVIISLIGACLLLAFVSVSLRRCIRGESAARTARSGGGQSQQQSGSYIVKSKGLEKAAVDALPLVHLADLDSDERECPVCLTDFEPEESLRLLPSCKHVFHQECIDAWFDAHSTCPLCRASLLADAATLFVPPLVDPADLIIESDQSAAVPATTPPLDTVTESRIESEPVKEPSFREPSFRKPSMRITGDLIALRNLVMRGQNEAPSRRWFTRARSLELGRGRVEEREKWVTIDLETGKAAAAIAEGSSSSSSSGSSERALPERAWSERWSLRGAVRFPLTRSTSDVSSSRPSAILPI